MDWDEFGANGGPGASRCDAILIYHARPGGTFLVEVGGKQYRYQPHAHRFDYFSGGSKLVATDLQPGRQKVLKIPRSFEAQVLGRLSRPASGSRVQFNSRRLERLVASRCRPAAGLGRQAEVLRSYAVLEEVHGAPSSEAGPTALSPFLRCELKRLIEGHLAEPWTVADLAMLTGLTESAVRDSFRHVVGTTFHQFLVGRRVERAALLLATTDASVSQVAQDCGFASHAHLSHAFRARKGLHTDGVPSHGRSLSPPPSTQGTRSHHEDTSFDQAVGNRLRGGADAGGLRQR
ncbi:AraC family transcriptional regulator [Piscinibacter sakaiensis]|uniref:HTH araC/xylS-type domain-containing protein n=1 Tax=Piscinibacter sakaiensis TaxID=1547922 RepID=A0A0K8NZG5_PISS1|nr:AraC family transcriptional regulator [Piscinibacter sakaiensis]GAP35797.1 hypothetical protein ISF6_1570 [Piscinibacter sakaiensis]